MREIGLAGAVCGRAWVMTTQTDPAADRPTDLGRPALHRDPTESALCRGFHVRRDLAWIRLRRVCAATITSAVPCCLSRECYRIASLKSYPILRAVDRTREYLPLRAVLRFLQVSPSRFHAWRRLKIAFALDDRSSCPHTSPHRLTSPEVQAIRDMVTSPEYRAVPTNILHLPARVVVTAADHLSSRTSRNISSS